MTAEALAAWDRALGDLRAAGAVVEPFAPAVTRVNYRDAFAAAAASAAATSPSIANSPAPTANALLHYFAGRTDDPRAAMRRGYAAYRAFYDVLPATFEECEPLLEQPMADDPAGRSFARSRAEVVATLAASMRAAGVAAMVYPTMPFNAPRAVDRWPDVRTPLGYGNWLGLPEVSVPAGLGADGMPRAQRVDRRAAGRGRARARARARIRGGTVRLVAFQSLRHRVRQSHLPQHLTEARLVAQRAKSRVDPHVVHEPPAAGPSLQPIKRLRSLAQRGVDRRDGSWVARSFGA